jgi:hypothetical protein
MGSSDMLPGFEPRSYPLTLESSCLSSLIEDTGTRQINRLSRVFIQRLTVASPLKQSLTSARSPQDVTNILLVCPSVWLSVLV